MFQSLRVWLCSENIWVSYCMCAMWQTHKTVLLDRTTTKPAECVSLSNLVEDDQTPFQQTQRNIIMTSQRRFDVTVTLLPCVSTGIVLQLTKPPFTVVSNHLPQPPSHRNSDSGWGPFKWLEATACASGPRDSARYFVIFALTHTLCISRNGSGLGIFFFYDFTYFLQLCWWIFVLETCHWKGQVMRMARCMLFYLHAIMMFNRMKPCP